MNKKISLGIAISLMCISAAITYLITSAISLENYNTKLSQKGEQDYKKTSEIITVIRANYFYSGEINDASLFKGIYGGLLNNLGSGSKYLSADEYFNTMQWISGNVVTAGINTKMDVSGYILVLEVYPGSSAYELGLCEGDLITEIDGQKVLTLGEKALKLIPGEENTKISLTFIRNGVENSVILTRRSLQLKTVEGIVYNEIGYVRITDFTELTGSQFVSVVKSLEARNVKGFIFDVRGLSGERANTVLLLPVISEMLDYIIPSTVAATAIYSDGRKATVIETFDGKQINLPMVVLIDKGTSSLAEIFAAGLSTSKKASLVGQASFGNVVLNDIFKLSDGTAVSFPAVKLIASGGLDLTGVGLIPEFLVDSKKGFVLPKYGSEIQTDSDAQLKKAFEIINVSGKN